MTTGTNISEVMVTVYKDVFSKEPHYVKLSTVIERIRSGKSMGIVQKVRAGDSGIKTTLPSICFSGVFVGARSDNGLKTHSGLVILDFDKLSDVELQKLL